MAKVLITGVSGMLGSNIALAYKRKNKVLGFYHNHKVNLEDIAIVGLNLLDLGRLEEAVSEFRPDILIHCAALTNIDKCEEDKELAWALNVQATENVVRSLAGCNSKLVYISTDAVYDGKRGNFQEDEVNPINYYGQTKLLGEEAALRHENTLVLRTNIFGWNAQDKFSLAEWILHSLEKREVINGFSDAIFSTIYTFLFANILEKCLERNLDGIYNLGASNYLNKYDFARIIADKFNLDASLVKEASVDKSNFKVERGKTLSMNTSKLQKDLSQTLPTVEDSINAFYEDYKNNILDKFKN